MHLYTYCNIRYHELSADSGSAMNPIVNVSAYDADALVSATRTLYFVNGQWLPTITVPVGGAATLRMAAAHGLKNVAMSLDADASLCKLFVIATDGV